MESINTDVAEIKKEAVGLPRKMWNMTAKVFTRPSKIQKVIIIMCMLGICIGLYFSNVLFLANSKINAPAVNAIRYVAIAFLGATLVKNILTNKGNAICFNISVFLIFMGLLSSYAEMIAYLNNVAPAPPQLDIVILYTAFIVCALLMILEYLTTDFWELNSDGAVGSSLQRVKVFRWGWVAATVTTTIMGIRSLKKIDEDFVNQLASKLLFSAIKRIVLLDFPYVAFSLFMVTREFEGFTQYKKPQRKKILLNAALCLMQYVLLLNIDILYNLPKARKSGHETVYVCICAALFFYTTILSLFKSFKIDEANEEGKPLFPPKSGTEERTERIFWRLSIFSMILAIVLTVTIRIQYKILF